jgi:hypothetical protein
MRPKITIAHLGPDIWFNYKADIIYGWFHTLRRGGYDATIVHNQLEKNALNVLIGADWLANPAQVDEIRKKQTAYVIYEVEDVHNNTINQRKDFDFESYKALLSGAQQVITPYQSNVMTLGQLVPSERVVYAPWGWYPELRQPYINRGDYSFDLHFLGLVKGSRKQQLHTLSQQYGLSIAVSDQRQPTSLQYFYMCKARFGLHLNHQTDQRFVNPFRLLTLAANDIPIVTLAPLDPDNYLNLAVRIETGLDREKLAGLEYEGCMKIKHIADFPLEAMLLPIAHQW